MNIITWNMQGASHSSDNKWNGGVINMLNNGADIICLQECGSVPASAEPVNHNGIQIPNVYYYLWGTERLHYHILFYPADPNGNRCNLAIVAKFPPQSARLVNPAQPPIWRPALGFQVDNNNFVFTLHAISPDGPDAVNLLTAINNSCGAGKSWVAAGDYNREPLTLVTPFTVCPPNCNTRPVEYPVKMLDYCVKNFNAPVTGTVIPLVMSDHYPVRYDIR